MSQVTTHILDTSIGKPASDVAVILQKAGKKNEWITIGMGLTDADGRIKDLLSTDRILEPGVYHLIFDTKTYYSRQGKPGFYPSVTIEFELADSSHYHVPLLLNPFGYSTYRGS